MQMVDLLQILVSNSGLPDPLTRRARVLIEAVTATNISMNAAQWAGTAGVTGLGPAVAGAPRVTPSSDTNAGVPAYHTQAALHVVYNAIATS